MGSNPAFVTIFDSTYDASALVFSTLSSTRSTATALTRSQNVTSYAQTRSGTGRYARRDSDSKKAGSSTTSTGSLTRSTWSPAYVFGFGFVYAASFATFTRPMMDLGKHGKSPRIKPQKLLSYIRS